MKVFKLSIAALLIMAVSFVNAQVSQIDLEQTKGKFTQENLVLASGSYQFNVANNNVGTDVGFVLVPEGKYDQANHIKEAYVKEVVANNSTSMTNVVDLEPGVYEYFCPMNNTPKYKLTVLGGVETIRLNQVDGDFTVKGMTITEGTYQFDIVNDGVDRQLGFVLAPKGTSAPEDHIKEAYVKSPVSKGENSMTNIMNLEPGVYEYFCPLNPTPKYTLTVVKDKM